MAVTVASLQDTALQVQQYETAAGYYQQSVDNEVEKLRRGLSTLIDTITTEQRQLDASLAQVSSRQRWAELLASLRFETGTLVSELDEGSEISEDNVLTLPVLAATAR